MILDIVKVLLPSALAFLVGILITPYWTRYLYSHQMWKKKAGKTATTGENAPIFNELHKDKEVGTPRLGGVIIWVSVLLVTVLLWMLSRFSPFEIFEKLEFVSRNQTWIPFAVLMVGACVGIIDDILEIKYSEKKSGGLSLKKRLLFVGTLGLLVGAWFYTKLDISSIDVIFLGPVELGYLIIPFFALVMIATYAGGVIDGLDGLAGGVFASIFSAYSAIAFFQMQYDVAAFCAVIVGAILAFLWFNIPPARFYMTETGSMALTLALVIVAFMTDTLGSGHGVSALPIIAFPLFATAASSLLQVASKKIRGKKIFLVAPLHHHFEAIGWPATKVVMRYWVISVIFAVLGIILALVS